MSDIEAKWNHDRPAPAWWRIVGIRRRHGRFLRVAPTRWGWTIIIVAVFVAATAGFMEYSMQPQFCRSCHVMEPYYRAWHESTHRQVPCGDCHFEPGWKKTLEGKWQASSQAVKFITGTYGSKPHAEVRDVSCLRDGCHERRLLEGAVRWTIKTQHGRPITIRFNHTPHLTELRRGKKLRCVSCHSQIVQGQHLVVTLDTCFLCHFKGLKHGRDEETLGGCRSCHDAPKQAIRLETGMFNHAEYIDRGVACQNCHADAVVGDGSVPKQLCWTCHNKPQQVARYGETSFIHDNHVTKHKVDCASCHIQIVHHLNAASPGLDVTTSGVHTAGAVESGACGQCHQQSHNGPLALYRGVGGRGVADMPSPMYRAQVDCIACHRQREYRPENAAVVGQTFIAAQSACDECHGSRYRDRLTEWKAAITAALAAARQAVAEAGSQLRAADLDAETRLKLQRMLDDAEHNVRFVELGRGVHNVTYATALLNVAVENARQIVDSINKGTETAQVP